MSEEKPSETLEFFILMFGLVSISIILAKSTIDGINTMSYFFSKANAKSVSDDIAELITVSGGSPGKVGITYQKPRGGFEYDIDISENYIIVESANPNDNNLIYEMKSWSSYPVKANILVSSQADFEYVEIVKDQEIQIQPKGGI
ncbi:MAG: hypothetical protein N3D75_03055 [Candidatus Aenigmarchaeota archaeon]|nr:hypothetical protein [Candidatus Aenigmarchaeota archaeon]